ncbi:MAG: hypothetical protein RBU21_02480 [FCB group bacterium]|jgi:hypothetical protein|nr:hypothetical protein [FCB group bacterium]
MSTQAIAQLKSRRLSPFATLLWEEWRQTRLPLLAGTALTTFILLSIAIPLWRNPAELHDEDSTVTGILSLLFCWQAAVLLFSGYGRNDMTMQFPRRLFALPVPSAALALTRLLYGIAVVAVTFGALGWLLAQSHEVFRPGFWYALIAVPTLVYIEGLAWYLGKRPLLAAGLGLLLYLPLLGLCKGVMENLPGPPLAAALLVSTPVIALFTALALYAVRTQRHGGGNRITTRRSIANAQSDANAAPQAPERALFGYEWRRRGRWVPAFGLLSAFLLMMLFSGVTLSAMASYFALLVGCLSGLFAAGLFQFLVSERERVSGLQRFLMTRPASTRNLGIARLRALGTGYSITFVVLCLLMLGALHVIFPHSGTRTIMLRTIFSPIQFVEDRMDEVHKPSVPAKEAGDKRAPAAISPGREPLTPATRDVEVLVKYESVSWGLVKVLTSLAFFFLLGWLCLTQPLTTLFVFYVVAVLANSLDGKAGWESDWGYTGFSAIVSAAILGLTVTHLRRAFRRGLLSRRALYTVLVAWFALAYAAVYLCVRAGGTPREVLGLQSSLVAFALVLAAFALPFWPFATIPLSIYRHRHQ